MTSQLVDPYLFVRFEIMVYSITYKKKNFSEERYKQNTTNTHFHCEYGRRIVLVISFESSVTERTN